MKNKQINGVVLDDKIEGVGEEQIVECPPVASGERGSHGRRSATMVGDLNTVAGDRMHMLLMMANYRAIGGRRLLTAAEVEGGRRFTFAKC